MLAPRLTLKVTSYRTHSGNYMKTMNKTLAWMMAAALSVVLISNATAQDSKQRTGKVVRIKGDARYSTGNKVWQPLKVGTTLKSGNVVQTAANSFVDVVINEEATAEAVAIKPISTAPSASSASSGGGGAGAIPTPDQDVVRILDDSYLVFDSLNASATGADTVTETLLDLKKGSIFGSVKKQAAASRFEIKTPNGVAGIRGTIFLISVNSISCLTGSVICAFTDAQGNVGTQVVGAGQQFNTVTRESSALGGALMNSLRSMASDCYYAPGDRGGRGRGRGHGGHDHGHDHVSRSKP